MSEPNPTPAAPPARQLSPLEHAACAWPLVLVAVGGALGGACGAAAWALNARIMASARPAPVRYGLVVLTGLGAGALYFLGVLALAAMFPNVFASR